MHNHKPQVVQEDQAELEVKTHHQHQLQREEQAILHPLVHHRETMVELEIQQVILQEQEVEVELLQLDQTLQV
tara:strand:+ start:267 stop:485 length:219 start_codon:yes stop_codon:yes gene_type:complete